MRERLSTDTVCTIQYSQLFSALAQELLAVDEVLSEVLPINLTQLFSSGSHIKLGWLVVDMIDYLSSTNVP